MRIFVVVASILVGATGVGRAEEERSFWLHASLGPTTQLNYFGPDYPAAVRPRPGEVEKAARVLSRTGANRLYLIYHRELPWEEAQEVFRRWKAAAPAGVEIVPALVLRMYNSSDTPIFSLEELKEIARFFSEQVNSRRLAVYDIMPRRDLRVPLEAVRSAFSGELIRLGLQPDEKLEEPFTAGVVDTWSAFCHGKRNEEDWAQPGFGAETLRKWVLGRNGEKHPLTWDLITVAWDYSATKRGAYPGYDDARKNMPLPSGRNARAARLIEQAAVPEVFGGFSSDLYILHENSRTPEHDGPGKSFYETLRHGEEYRGYYAQPWKEIVTLFRQRAGAK